MQQSWSRIGVGCPDCKVKTVLVDALVSADQEFRFIGICPKCKAKVAWQQYASALAYEALCNDIERALQTPTIPTPVRPPIQLPPVVNHEPILTDDDIRWSEEDRINGHSLGIKPDDEGGENETHG